MINHQGSDHTDTNERERESELSTSQEGSALEAFIQIHYLQHILSCSFHAQGHECLINLDEDS